MPEECAHHGPIDGPALHGITGISKHRQQQNRQYEDHHKTDPVIRLGVPVLHANELRREICAHQTDRQEQDSRFRQQDRDASQFLNRLRVLERNQVEVLVSTSARKQSNPHPAPLPKTSKIPSHSGNSQSHSDSTD